MYGYRGRLIWPRSVEIYRLDLASSTFDPQYREPLTRAELAAIRVPCQVEEENEGELQQRAAGNDPNWKMHFVFFFRDLEEGGLVDPTTGAAMIKVNDRATAIFTDAGDLIQRLDTDAGDGNLGGLYCVEARPTSFGLTGGQRNLLVTTFQRRAVTQ